MAADGGLITRDDLKAYQAKKRDAAQGTYRGYDIIGDAAAGSGGVGLIEMLNILEGYDLKATGYGSAASPHLIIESMRRAVRGPRALPRRPRLRPGMPVARLTSKEYADALRKAHQPEPRLGLVADDLRVAGRKRGDHAPVRRGRASGTPWSLTYTLEAGYGSKIVVAGRRLPAEQRDGRLQRRARA